MEEGTCISICVLHKLSISVCWYALVLSVKIRAGGSIVGGHIGQQNHC